MTMATVEEVRATLKTVLTIARAVCETYLETGLPVPQGPMYAQLMGIISLEQFQGIMRVLAKQGFIVTRETIEPGDELRQVMDARKEMA